MLVNDTNFVTPSFNEVKPENNINLISPLNFLRTAQNNSPIEKSVESTFDWKKDFDSFIQTVPKKYDLTTYYNEKQYEKYHKSLLGKPIFKDPRYYDNEDLNAERQGFLGSLFNGSVKMIPSFLQAFVSTNNPMGYDNTVSNAMQDFSKNMENWFPNYYSKEERENPLSFNSIFSGNFLGDKLIKNLGFIGGAMTAALMQDAIIGFMTGGTGLAPTIALQTGRAANWMSKAFKANTIASKLVAADKVENFLKPLVFKGEKALEYFNDMTKGQKLLTSVKTNLFLANASHGEAAIEALEGLTRVREDLIQSYKEKNGILPDAVAMAEINKLASEAGNIRYGLNFATIFLTDAIQFGSLFKPFKSYTTGQTLLQGLGGSGERLVLNEAGQLVRRNLSKSEKVLGALTGDLVQANISESIQEGLQYSFETATHDYAKKKWNKDIRGGLGDYLHEQVNGLKRMVTDVEGRESMLLGFLTGFAAHGFKKGVEKLQGRPSLEKREDSIMSDFNSIDFDKMFDTTELSELVKRDVETFNGRTTQEIILNQMQDAIKSGNVFDFKSLQHELFFNGIRTANALGKFDAFVEKLEAMKQLAPEEFSKVFGIEVKDSNVVSQYIDKLKDQAVKTKEIIEAVDNTIPNTIDYKKESKLWTAFNDLKTTMAFHLSSLDNITSRIDSVTSTLLENNPSMTEDLIDKISDIENFSNKFLLPLNQERRSLLNTLEVMSQLKEEKDEALFNKTKQQLKDLDDHIDNLNKHANTIKEHFNKTNNWTADAILNYKQLVLEVLQYNQQRESGNKIAYTETQLEDTLKALIDFQKLKKSLGIVIDESNKLQTPEGRDKYLRDHIAFLEKYSDSFSEMIKKVNISTVKKFRDQEIATIAGNISDNITQIETIKNQIEEIDKQLLDEKTTPEEKELLEKRKEELIKEKQELLDENKELEETKEVIEGKENTKELNIEEQIQLLEKELSTIEDDNNPRIKEIDDEISKLEKLLKNESEEDLNSETEDKTSIEDINPVETPTETGEKEIIITETPNLILEAKKAPLHGKSRVLMTVGKMGNTLPKDMKFAGGMLQNFYNFMGRFETFDGNLHMHNLNSFLSRNKYKFVLMVAPDVLYTKLDEKGRSEYFTEGTQNPDNIVIVLVDETNNPVLIDGNYIASKVGKDATKDSAWLNKGKLPDDNQSLIDAIKEVREKGFADLAIESTSAGHYNFIGKKEKFEIKELNPNTSFEIFTHTELKEMGSNFRGYTLLPGKLYLKVVNGRKTVMYLDVSLSKMSNIKVKGEPISKNIFDLINHLNNNEESDVYRKSVESYLNSIFHTYHITKGGKVPAIFRVGESFYKFEVNVTENNASIRIIKDGEVAYELSKEKQDELSKLQSLLKIFDINDKIFFGKEINLPTIEDGKLRFNLIPYTDFILENANPTVNYKLDFSTENPFEYTNGEIYFKLPSKVEEAFSETSTTYNQSEIEAKKADIERRIQEVEDFVNQDFFANTDVLRKHWQSRKDLFENKLKQLKSLLAKGLKTGDDLKLLTNILNDLRAVTKEGIELTDKNGKISDLDSVIDTLYFDLADSLLPLISDNIIREYITLKNESLAGRSTTLEKALLQYKYEDRFAYTTDGKDVEYFLSKETLDNAKNNKQINAKYDAELKQPEQPIESSTKPTTTEIEAKKADIKIGKVGNTEYEVKSDGVYFEGRKLSNPKNLSHKELIAEDIRRRKEEELDNVKPVYHHTQVKPEEFNFSSFQRGSQSISQFGDGLNASSNTTSFFVNRYGKPIQGEVNDKEFVEIDANKTEKEIYEYLKTKSYKFSQPASEYTSNEKANYQPAIIELFQDFQKSNPGVKGVKVSNHIIGGQKVAPFYIIYDSKSFYGQDSLKNKINVKYNAELESLNNQTVSEQQGQTESQSVEQQIADIERRRQEDLETTKNIGEDKLKEGRENTKKIVESLKQRYPATSVQGIIIRILEKLIDFSKYSTIVDSEYINSRNASGQATWFGMMISQETLDGILAGKEHEVHTFIHEFIHGFTTSKISDYNIEKQGLIPGFKSKLTAKEKNAIEQLQRIFEKVKRDNPKSKEYGFTNLDEFIAEAFSNTSFQYTLKNTKAEGKKSNLFSEFLEAIGDLLFEQLERWAKRFNKEIPERSTITGILEDVLAWTEDLIDQNNKLAYIATNEEINAKYDAEYVNAVKKGEMTKEQAMQALKEVGRKDSKAYAELAASEGTSTQAPTTATVSNIEAKKAEIEKERQEALDNLLFYNKPKSIGDFLWSDSRGSIDFFRYPLTKEQYQERLNYALQKVQKQLNDEIENPNKYFNNQSSLENKVDILNDIIQKFNNINAKYDAELATLKSKTATDIEAKKAEIEKLEREIEQAEKEKQETLQPLIEEKEQIEKEIAEIEEELSEAEKLEEQPTPPKFKTDKSTKSVDAVIEENVTEQELKQITQEESLKSKEEAKEKIKEEVVNQMNDKTNTKPKTLLQKIAYRIKKILLNISLVAIMFNNISFTFAPSATSLTYDNARIENLQSFDDVKLDQDALNKLEDINIITEFNKDSNEKYLIVDKNAAMAHLYQGDSLITSYEVGTGKNKGDAQTKTVTKNGKVYWEEGNAQTGAGIYTINNQHKYKSSPSYTLLNENGIEVSTVLHETLPERKKLFADNNTENNRMSYGCVNFQAKSLQELGEEHKDFTSGSKVYILPDNPNNKFKIVDGKLIFSSENKDVNRTLKKYEAQPITVKADNINEKGKEFLQTIADNKSAIMDLYPTVSNDEYNQIVKIAYGIFGQESSFGTFGGVTGLRGQTGRITDLGQIAANSLLSENYNPSVGVTQIRYSNIRQEVKDAFGISEISDLLNTDKAAIATISHLLDIYVNEIPNNLKDKADKLLPLAYSNHSDFIKYKKNKDSNLLNNKYVQNVNKNGENVKIYLGLNEETNSQSIPKNGHITNLSLGLLALLKRRKKGDNISDEDINKKRDELLDKVESLKQRLAEVNKKIDEVTKRFDTQIAQKQAELKALEEAGSVGVGRDVENKKKSFTEAGEQSKKDQSPKALGNFIIDNAQVGDRIKINENEYYEVVSKKTNKKGHTETELQHFVKNEETGEFENNPAAVKLFTDKYRGTDQEKLGYRDASDLFESTYTNNKGERVTEQSTFEPKVLEQQEPTIDEKTLEGFVIEQEQPIEVKVKKDDKSYWTLIQNPDGTIINKDNGEKITDKSLINKAHLESGFVKYEKITANNKKEYALTEDGRVISLNKTSLGQELDIENSSIAKDVISKGTKFTKPNIVVEQSSKPLEQSNDLSELTKEVVKPEKKSREKFNINKNTEKLFSSKKLSTIPSLNVTNTDIEKVKAIFKGNVNIENLFQIANSDAWATFQQSAITLYKGATRADLYHEAWHHFSQLYLTKDEKIKLYEETRNRVKDLKDESDLEVEEYIAREFAKFTETGKIEGKFPERKSIFQKIMDFLKSIFSNETDLSLDSLFNNLYKGQINHLAYNTENIMFGKLNSSINDSFNYNDSKLIESGLNGLLVRVLKSEKASISEISKIRDINIVYRILENELKEMYNNLLDDNNVSSNDIFSDNLERLLENWNDVKRFHFENSIIFNKDKNLYTVNEEGQIVSTDENEDEKKGRNKADYQEASERSVFDILPSEIKNLIYTLVDKDKNGNEIIDPIFGFPKLVDFQRYVQVISQKLSDQTDFSDVEKALTELAATYPPMKDLLESLTLNDSNEVKQLRVKFINSMALAKVKLYTILYNEENKDYQAQDVFSNTRRQAESNATSYFNISPETRFIKKVNGENQITQIGNVDYNEDNVALLKDLGMDMSFTDYMSTEQLSSFLKNLQIPFLVNHLRGYLKQHGVIKDVFKALNTKIDGQSRDSVFKRIVKADLEVNPAYISATSLNAENKLESENVLWSTITKDIKFIQKAKSISELVQNPNRSHFNFSAVDMDSSVLLDLMFDKNGNRTNFEININNYNGINNTKQGETGVKTKDVYYIEKAIMDISQFINNNILTTMQLSNKATYLGFKLSNKLFNDKYDFEEKMLKYLFTELDIIEKFHNGDPELTKLKKLSEAIGTKDNYSFAIFKNIIINDTQEIINEYLETGNLSGKTKTNILEQINSFFNKEKRLHINFLGENLSEIVPSSGSKYSKDTLKETLLDDYIKNQFIFNVELSKITFGNPYMHKDPYKRIAGATSTGTRLLVDDLTLQDFESATKETQRSSVMPLLLDRLGLKEFNFKNQRSSNKELRFITFKDREMLSKYYNDLLDAVNSELSKHQENSPEYKALLEKKKSIQKAYSKLNGSDAMGAVTMDAWRKFNWLAGRWSPELEKIYEKTIKWDYHNRLLKKATNEEEKVKQLALRNENAIDEAEKLAISVMKYQYYGNVKNTTIMEKAFHKFQLMPLIPQLIEGKLYEHHLDRMIMEDVDYLLFDSADKLEKTKTPNNFYNNKEQDNVFVLEDFVNTYRQGDTSYDVRTGFIENLKEQVFMENGTDNSLLFGTQIRALLFNTDSFSELYDEFRDVINQLTQIEKDKLYEKASLNSNGEVIDKNRFVQFLLDELDKKVVNYNVKDYLRLTKAGEFAGSLDTNLQRTPIESIINSVIQNKIVKQKMHGEMMVQVSNVGFETFGKKDSLKFYGYEQDGKVRKMEVKIPLSGKFKNLLNLNYINTKGEVQGKIESRERLNDMISRGLIDTRAITMVGYRIPTQEHNSVEVMIVQEFLDPISNLIVVPYEITAKAGSDFDIDKLNIFKPHIDENGNYITNIEKPTDLDYINLSEIKEKIKAKKETVQKSWEIQSNKLQKLYNERLINKEEVSNNIEELRYTLRETNIEIAFLKEDILILKELNQENKAVSNLLITIFSDNAIKNKNLEEIIKEKEDKILKYNNDNKLRKELIEQFKELSTKSSEEIVRIEKRKQTQEKYLSDLNALFIELNDISYKIKNHKGSTQNRIIEIFEKVLLDPNNFINLITPNSTSLFDEAINNVFKVRYTEQERQEKKGVIMPKDIVYTNSLLPRNSWDMHRVFGDSGKGLGIAAVGNKFSQLIQKAKVNFTDEYLEKYNLRFKLGDLSNRNFQNGESKGTAFSQLINLLVDVANDPRVGYVNMGDNVIPIVNLMINFGIDIEQIIYLINQPIVVDYVDYVSKNSKRLIKSKNDKTSFSSYLAKKVFNFRSPLSTISKEYEIDKDSSATEIAEKLGNIPLENKKENIGLKISQINSEEQLLILSQFVQFEEMAADFLELQMTMNFDTNLVQDGFEAFQKENSFEDIKTRNIFTNLDELKYNTVISPLNVLKEVVNINAQLLPLANSKLIYNFLSSKLSNDFKFKKNKHKAKFIRTFKNDFIMYLFQNFLGRSEKALLNFNTTFAPVLKTNEQDFTNKPNEFGIHLIKNLYKEFAEIKNNPKYKDLFNQYLLLDRLFVTSEEEFKNIGLSYYNKDSELQNTYIEQFKELLNNPDLEIRNFMLKFAYMGFYQSGLNKSLMSSTDILPIKLLSPILENIREQYLLEINDDRKLLSTLYDFHKLMYDNNEFMRSNKEMKNSDGSPMFYDKNGIRRYNSPLNNRTKVDSKRFKDYTSNIDKVLEDAKPLIPSNTIQKEIVQEDKFIFEYKGKKINTEFELSEDQSQALKELIDFTKDSNESAIVLQGAAGTGKTSIIGYLQKYLNEQFLYTAPTHAATVELAFGTMKTGNTVLPITVASSLKLNKDTGKHVLSKKASRKIGFGNIIVIDETSMLNTYDYKRLLDLKELGYKLIFIGDKKQIPEVSKVKDLDFKTISNAFVENKIINLDVIHRTSNKNIKNILQKVRDSITFQLFKLKENTINVQFFKSDVSFKQKLKEFVLKDPQNTDYIAYTNKSVRDMNKLIREQIFGRKGEIQKDDIVMGYLGYQSKQVENSDLANSISYRVEKVEKTKNGYNLTLSSERLDKLREKGFTEIGEFSYTTLLPLSNKEAIENSFDQKIYDENNQNLSNRFKILYEYLQQAKNTNSGRDWNRYYNYHESLSFYMAKNDLAADYIYNIHTNQFESFDKTEPSKEHAKLLSFYKTESNNFIVEKGIDFGHAITVHKSQGRTTKNVFFDANTIKKGDTKIMEKDVQISTENQSLGYVGLSRASENLFINEGWVSFKEIDTVEEDNTPTQQTTEQPINKEIKINEIYNQLGDKTKSENVILPKDVDPEADNIGMTYTTAIDFWRKIVPAAMDLYNKSKPLIVAFRGNSKKTFLQNYNSGTHTIGNPFDFRDEAGDRKEQGVTSTKKFIEWMITGNNFGNINASEEYRQAIIKDIKSGKLKKASILYYEEKGYATHATALDYLINKYDWNKEQPTEIKPKIEVVNRYSDSEVKANPDKIYVFGDNTDRKGTGGQATIRNNPNAFGIATKVHPTNNSDAFMSDKDLESNKKVIDSDIQKILDQNKLLVFPKDGFGTGLAKLEEKAPQTYKYLKDKLLEKFGFNNDTGELTQEQPIVDNNKEITKEDTDKLPPCIG